MCRISNKTQQLLATKGISVLEVQNHSPEELAAILGVDAVVHARIQKNRLMSDLASYGIELGVRILNVLTDHAIWPWLPLGVTTSKEIQGELFLAGQRQWRDLMVHLFQCRGRLATKSQ